MLLLRPPMSPSSQEAMAAFAEFDSDGSGYLEVGELVRAIRRIDPNLTDQEVRVDCSMKVCLGSCGLL